MRLSDFSPSLLNEIARPSREVAETVLQQAGYERLGDPGLYGVVYAKPGQPYVLKLFDNDDAAYRTFIYYAKANPNPHFPQFRGQPIKVNDEYSVIRMERLEPLENSIINRVGTDIYWYWAVTNKPEKMKNSFAKDRYQRFFQLPKSLVKAVVGLVSNVVLPHGFMIDTHSRGNIMRRGKTLVLTDPVWLTGAGLE